MADQDAPQPGIPVPPHGSGKTCPHGKTGACKQCRNQDGMGKPVSPTSY
jgi:hypothetical protein